jgi:hypothetical protein
MAFVDQVIPFDPEAQNLPAYRLMGIQQPVHNDEKLSVLPRRSLLTRFFLLGISNLSKQVTAKPTRPRWVTI